MQYIMKKYITSFFWKHARQLLATLILLPAFLSCADFLDKEPDDMLTLDMVFNDKRRTEYFLAGVYNLIPDPLYGFQGQQYSSMATTDDCQIPSDLISWGWDWTISVNEGGWNPINAGYNLWANTYKNIRSAYIFLENAKALPSQGVTEADVEIMKCEARFLICYYYVRMLELYGPFPLITRLIPSNTPIEELKIPRTPFDEIVDWLDKELVELSKLLPTQYTTDANSRFGRPTSGMCLAVRARMLLYAASPLFNGNSDYYDVKNPDGTPLFPQKYDAAKWERAARACKELIDLAEKGTYELFIKRNPDGSIDPFLSFQDLFLTSGETNKEIIFSRRSVEAENYLRYVIPRGAGGWGSFGATQNLVDAFLMRNGLPITDPQSGYVEEGFVSEPIYYNTRYNLSDENATEGLVVAPGVYNMYANREPRFYISIRFNNQWIHKERRNTEFYNGGRDGRPNMHSPICGYQPRKYVNPNDDARSGYFPFRPAILYRLGEFYLNYAEALIESNPSHPDILKYLNRIRQRAGIPDLPASLLGNQEELRKAVRRERRVELAFETNLRQMDIRRWLIGEEVFAEPIVGMDQWAGPENYYRRTEITKRFFHKKMYLWPIPQGIIDNNSNIIQNKFW